MSTSESTQHYHSSKHEISQNDEYQHLDISCNASFVFQSCPLSDRTCNLFLFTDICHDLIAMSYPSNKEECEENPDRYKIEEVKHFLEEKNKGHYYVIKL